MTQRSKTRLFWGIRLIALIITVVLAYRAYQVESYLGLIGVLFSVGLGLVMTYSNRQNETLVLQNMKKHGLEPDRDEAPPSA